MVQRFSFEKSEIEGLIEVTPFCAEDGRGSFIKDYSTEVFLQNCISHDLKEVFYTVSKKGVVRALHFQRIVQQPKYVRCITGSVFDVVVDLRKNSPTFKKWVSFQLTGDNQKGLIIPGGCAHGYLVLEDSIVSYKCSEKFYGEYDDGIKWDDKDIGIDWPINLVGGADKIIISEKDKNLQSFSDFIVNHEGLQ